MDEHVLNLHLKSGRVARARATQHTRSHLSRRTGRPLNQQGILLPR